MSTGIRILRGRKRSWDITVKTGNVARDVSNDIFLFTVKTRYTDADNEALMQLYLSGTFSDGIAFVDAPNGVIRLTIDGSRTRDCPAKRTAYLYDMKIMYDGDANAAYDLDHGSFVVEPDVTTATGI